MCKKYLHQLSHPEQERRPGNVGVIAAQHDLTAHRNDAAQSVDAGVDDGLFAAGADGLDLGDGVGHLEQSSAALKQMGQKVGAQTKAENGDVHFIHDVA